METLLLWLLMAAVLSGVCKGSVYKVGDSPGWTIIGNVNYHTWASSKTFHVGDTLVFEYDPRFHNVLQVSRSEYHICGATAPIANYTSGNDSIVISEIGHYYYLCGFVGHCQAGQKVDIRVPRLNQSSKGPTTPSLVRPPPDQADPKSSVLSPSVLSPSPNSVKPVKSCNNLLGFIWFVIWVVCKWMVLWSLYFDEIF